jgi:non-ribosomal peptide synthase protein (TIGR01720 family)
LTVEETRALLQEVPASYGTEVNDVLIAALAQTMGTFIGSRRLFIEMEGHGREDLFSDMDVSRTVGWFTTLYPVTLDLNRAEWPGQVLRTVKEHLRQIPNHGIGCGLLRSLGRDEARVSMHSLPKAEISLNYLGQFAQPSSGTEPFFTAAEPFGPERSPEAHRTHILNVSGIIVDGQLRITWFYSENLHRPESIRHLADAFVHALREIISHCRSLDAGGYTPSDFPDVELSQDEIEALRAEIHEGVT